MKAGRCIATARASLRFKCCPGPRLQDRGPFTEESAPWPPHSSSGLPSLRQTSGVPRFGSASNIPDRVTPQASSADARHPRHPSHAAQAHSSCRYYGPSAASGSPGEADAPRALYPCSRPSAWPPSQLMFQVPTSPLSWQCHIVRCPSCWFAISYTPTAFTNQCPLQGCRRIQSRRRQPQPRRSKVTTAAKSRSRRGGGWRRKRQKTKTKTRYTVSQKCTHHAQPGSKAPLGPVFAHGPPVRTWPAPAFQVPATTLDNVS